MRTPYFGWKHVNKDYVGIKGETILDGVDVIGQFERPSENEFCAIFNYVDGKRPVKDKVNWDYWNGCVIIDVDYKVYIKNHSIYIEPSELFNNTFKFLQDNFSQHFYYAEVSRSGTSFHYIFGMNSDYPTEQRRNALYLMAYSIILYTYKKLGYGNIITYSVENENNTTSKVLDNCMDSFTQPCFFTGKGKINDKYEPEWRVISFNDDVNKIINSLKQESSKKCDKQRGYKSKYKASVKRMSKKDSVQYIDHETRWNLFRSLAAIYSGAELKKNWQRCAKLIPENNGHTTEYYLSIPYKLDWNDKIEKQKKNNESIYCDTDILKLFGYTVEFKTNEENKNEIITKIYEILNNGTEQRTNSTNY